MELTVRKPNLERLNEEGIPEDFAAVRDYFNYGIETQEGAFPFIPRRQPIITGEIQDRWMPSAKSNIGLVAELEGKVVGSIAAFFQKSTDYEHQSQRTSGDIGESVDPRVGNYQEVFSSLYRGLQAELQAQNKSARAVFPKEDSSSISVLRALGYQEKEIQHKPYKAIGLSGKGITFTIE